MKYILSFILLVVSVNLFGQRGGPKLILPEPQPIYSHLGDIIFGVPTNYQYRTVRERLIAFMIDSSLHIPRYNGTPVGIRSGASTNKGALAADTLNNKLYLGTGYSWVPIANIYNTSDSITASDTRLVGVWGASTSLEFRSKTVSTDVAASHFKMNAATIMMYQRNSSNQTYGFSSDYLNTFQFFDNRTTTKGLEYAADYSAGYTSRSLVDKAYVDAAGGGTVNAGALRKAAYYPSAGTTVDDFVGVEFGNTSLNTKIIIQTATDVGVEIKAAGSQSANLQNWSSSSGTGDLASLNSTGYFQSVRGGFGGAASSYPLQVYGGSDANARGPIYVTANTGTVGVGVTIDAVGNGGNIWSLFSAGSGASAPAGAWAIYNGSVTGYRMSQKNSGEYSIGQDFFDYSAMLNVKANTGLNAANFHAIEAENATIGLWADDGDDNADKWYLKSLASGNALTFLNNTTEYFRLNSTGGLVMPEIAAPSTPASGFTAIYPKSDGLWYGKDDAGVETKLSNAGATVSKGLTIEFPSASEAVDMWQTPVAITVSSLKAILRGSASPSVTYNIRFGTDITSSTDVFTSNITCTSVTTGCSNSSGFNDATIPAGSFIWIVTTAQSGTVNSIGFTINYTED